MSTDTKPPHMSYQDYLRAWKTYLEQHSRRGYRGHPETEVFFRSLEEYLRPSIRGHVREWPSVWPEVQYWFNGRDNFTRAVQHATLAATKETTS